MDWGWPDNHPLVWPESEILFGSYGLLGPYCLLSAHSLNHWWKGREWVGVLASHDSCLNDSLNMLSFRHAYLSEGLAFFRKTKPRRTRTPAAKSPDVKLADPWKHLKNFSTENYKKQQAPNSCRGEKIAAAFWHSYYITGDSVWWKTFPVSAFLNVLASETQTNKSIVLMGVFFQTLGQKTNKQFWINSWIICKCFQADSHRISDFCTVT